MEDALNRLDKLTQEEARMAAAEILRLTQIVDNKVTTVIDGESSMFAARGTSSGRSYFGQTGKKRSKWSNIWQAA
jgi:hypothetical protein